MDHRALAVSVIDISSDIRRKSLNDTGVRPLSNGVLEILRVIESHPGITVAEVASRLGRQFSNVSVQLRELVAAGLVTRIRDAADKRYVALHPTAESQRIKALLEGAWATRWPRRVPGCCPKSASKSPPACLPCSASPRSSPSPSNPYHRQYRPEQHARILVILA